MKDRTRNRSQGNRSTVIDLGQARERARSERDSIRASNGNSRRTAIDRVVTDSNGRNRVRSQGNRSTTIDLGQAREQARDKARGNKSIQTTGKNERRTALERIVETDRQTRDRAQAQRVRSTVIDLGQTRNQTQANNDSTQATNLKGRRTSRQTVAVPDSDARRQRSNTRSKPQEVFRRSTPDIQPSNRAQQKVRALVDRARASSQRQSSSRSETTSPPSRNVRASATQVERPTRTTRSADTVRSIQPSTSRSIRSQAPNASRGSISPRSISRSAQPRSTQPSIRGTPSIRSTPSGRPTASSFRSSTRSSSPGISRSRGSQAARGAMSRSSGGSRSMSRSGMSGRSMSRGAMSGGGGRGGFSGRGGRGR